jgi:predicted DNA-binding transcriptional regulator AlpA
MSATHTLTAPPPAPLPFTPRLLDADLAALYVGISKTNFLARVATGELPRSRRIGARSLWDRHTLDLFVDALFGLDEPETKDGNDFGD